MMEIVECDKDHMKKMMDNGEIVETNRYHCASGSHFPNVWGMRISVAREKAPDFVVPNCPWCGKQLKKGGLLDQFGLVIHGPA